MEKKIIEIKDLNKSFGTVHAVRDLSFQVRSGEFFSFLGVNGAGKSTTINILCGQLAKDSGEVLIDGIDASEQSEKIKKILGVVFQESLSDRPLSVMDNLKCRAALYGITGEDFRVRYRELSELLGLEELSRRPVGKLSGGQRRRIDIARALVHRPKILILDEPTTGLDPQTRKTIWQVISRLRKEEGMTVFLTTHYMEEASESDYIVILDAGQVVAEGTPLDLKNTYTKDHITLYGVTEEVVKKSGYPYETLRGAFRISVDSTAEATELILKYPEMFVDYEITKGAMDDVFLAVTGKQLTGGEKA